MFVLDKDLFHTCTDVFYGEEISLLNLTKFFCKVCILVATFILRSDIVIFFGCCLIKTMISVFVPKEN